MLATVGSPMSFSLPAGPANSIPPCRFAAVLRRWQHVQYVQYMNGWRNKEGFFIGPRSNVLSLFTVKVTLTLHHINKAQQGFAGRDGFTRTLPGGSPRAISHTANSRTQFPIGVGLGHHPGIAPRHTAIHLFWVAFHQARIANIQRCLNVSANVLAQTHHGQIQEGPPHRPIAELVNRVLTSSNFPHYLCVCLLRLLQCWFSRQI